jgi:hypothetical protein
MCLFIRLLVYLGCLLEFNAVPSDRRYEGTHCLNLPVMNTEAVRFSETSVNLRQMALRDTPEDGNLQIICRDNLDCYSLVVCCSKWHRHNCTSGEKVALRKAKLHLYAKWSSGDVESKCSHQLYRTTCTSLSRLQLPYRMVSAQYIWCLLLGLWWKTLSHTSLCRYKLPDFRAILNHWQQRSLQSVQCRDEHGGW